MPTRTLIAESLIEPLAAFVASAGANDMKLDLPKRSGASAEALGEPQASGDAVARLFENIAARLHRPSFGIDYASAFPVGGAGAMGFILTQAKDMRTAVKAIQRYTQIVVSGLDVTYQPVDGGAQLSWRYPISFETPHIQLNSFLAALVIIRLRAGLTPDWSPKLVQFAHREPGALDAYRRVFGPNVCFEQPGNVFAFRDAYLDRPNEAANPHLYKVVSDFGEVQLAAQKPASDFRGVVANSIVALMGASSPTLEAVAEQLGVGGRTVQRRLANDGATFEDVLGETRRFVAERLLRDTDLALTDIAFMLGFSELSAFTRAAKRWHGVPPRQFRASARARAS